MAIRIHPNLIRSNPCKCKHDRAIYILLLTTSFDQINMQLGQVLEAQKKNQIKIDTSWVLTTFCDGTVDDHQSGDNGHEQHDRKDTARCCRGCHYIDTTAGLLSPRFELVYVAFIVESPLALQAVFIAFTYACNPYMCASYHGWTRPRLVLIRRASGFINLDYMCACLTLTS